MPHQSQLDSIISKSQSDIETLVDKYTSGVIDAEAFGDEVYDVLELAHTHAYLLGIRQSGSDMDSVAQHTIARQQGRQMADGQMDYLNKFINDLESGRYTDDEGNFKANAIMQRANLYSGNIRGTANQAFVDESPQDSEYEWQLGARESCNDCPRMAALGPYKSSELFCVPGDGTTRCNSNCACHLVRQDGKTSFKRSDLAD